MILNLLKRMNHLLRLVFFGVAILASLPVKTSAASVTILTPSTFKGTLSANSGVVVVDFAAVGCGACTNLASSGLLDKLAASYSDGSVKVAEIIAPSFSTTDIQTITTNLGVQGVQSFPTIKIFVNGVDKGDLSNDTSNQNLLTSWQNALSPYTGDSKGTTATGPTATTIQNPPNAQHECRLVLVTITDTDKKNITDCGNVGFTAYLSALWNQMVPYIMLIALVLIVFSGFQYMMSGVSGDTKIAKTRIAGILGGIIFFFLIRLILNQIAPNLYLPDQLATNTPSVCTLQDEPPEGGDNGSSVASSAKLVNLIQNLVGIQYVEAKASPNHSCFDLSSNGNLGYNAVPIIKQLIYSDIPYPHYDESDCNGQACTVGSSGCGIVSSAMVLAFYGHPVSVPDLAQWALSNNYRYDGGTKPEYFPAIAAYAGLKSKVLNSWLEIVPYLKQGQPVIISGKGVKPFTRGSHYIVLTGYANGRVYVNDPWGGTERDYQSYPEDLIHSEYTDQHAFLFYK